MDADNDGKCTQQFNSIVCMSKSESLLKVYLLNGRLIKSVDFSDIMDKYGEPTQVSPDGTVFVFM